MTDALERPSRGGTSFDGGLLSQAKAARDAVFLPACSAEMQSRLLEASKTLANLATREQRTSRRRVSQVLTLPEDASPSEVRYARRRGAVQHGHRLYLPDFPESTYALPNVLLRSSLFASKEVDASLIDGYVAAQGQSSIWLRGPMLFDYDRQVLAAVIRRLSIEKPLTIDLVSESLTLSFWQLARMLGLTYGVNQHRAIKSSLARLSAVEVRVKSGGHDVSMSGLLRVSSLVEATRGRDQVELCIPVGLFELFGVAQWTSVPVQALQKLRGLPRWLGWYYRTHSSPYPLKLGLLRELSGSVCDLREFRRRLKNALQMLQSSEVDESVRIASFDYDAKADTLTVYATRWNEANRN